MYFLWCCILLGVFNNVTSRTTARPDVEHDFIITPTMQDLLLYGSPVLPSSSNDDGNLTQRAENITEAEYQLQRLAGLMDEQDLDQEILDVLNFPKCAFSLDEESSLIGRYATAPNKWKKTQLTYRITLYSRWLDADIVSTIIRDSFQLWSEVTPLTFTEVDAELEADITVKFQGREHGDPWPFDGRGGVLAHAFYPTGGQCHFDDDETWGAPSGYGFSLFQTAVHEIGHLLGLQHSNVPKAVMAPYYKFGSQYRIPVLGEDDIKGIQSLYGPPPPPTLPPPPEDACINNISAAMYNEEMEKNFLFMGSYMWSIDNSSTYVTSIESTFQFITADVTAAVYLPSNRKTYLFKGCYVYVYDRNLDFVRRRVNSQLFKGLPCNINSGFYNSADRITYFFKGMWIYAYQGFTFYGRIRIAGLRWASMPKELEGGIDAVYDIGSDDNTVYIIKGDHFYEMDRQTKRFSSQRYDVREHILTTCP